MQSNEKLRALVNLQTNQIKVLNLKLKDEIKAKKRLMTKFKAAAKARDKFYNNYINETAKSNKFRSDFLNVLIFGSITVVIAFVVLVSMVINILNWKEKNKMAAPITKDIDIKILVSVLFDKKGKIALSPKEVSEILGISESTLEKDTASNVGIPFFRLNGKEKWIPLYTLTAIAKTLVDNEVKIFN